MTVIAWDGKTLAADRRCCRGGTIYALRKVHRVGPLLIGLTGGSDFCAALLAWFQAGADPKDWPKSQDHEDYAVALVIDGGRAFTYDRVPHRVEMLEPVCAIGSVREVALGAMHMGATAAQAVEAASRWMDSCGNGCDTLELVP